MEKSPPFTIAGRVKLPESKRVPPPLRLVGGGLTIESRWPVCVLCLLSFALTSLIFAPISMWYLSYVCLVPWLAAVTTARRAAWTYGMSYLMGTAFWLLNIHWLFPITPPGHIALSVYLGCYFPIIAWMVRYMVRRRRGSVALILPFVWVGSEWLRSIVVSGFPWSYLAHSHYQRLTFIQISDLFGAYGVSFVIAAINGWLVDMMIQPILVWRNMAIRQPRRVPIATVFTWTTILFTVIYGRVRLAADTIRPGPRAAVCQQDYPVTVHGGDNTTPPQMLESMVKLCMEAGPNEPELIVWPESAATAVLNQEFLNPQCLADLMKVEPNELRRMRISIGQWRYNQTPSPTAFRALFPDNVKKADGLRDDLVRWYFAQPLPPESIRQITELNMKDRWKIGLYFDEWDYGQLTHSVLQALARGRYQEMIEPLRHLRRIWPIPTPSSLDLTQQPDRPPAWVVTGGYGYEYSPNPPPPRSKLDRFNSAYVYDPTGRQVQPRYDKIHCVLFGEYVPFRYSRLHWLYRWLNSITPWGASGFEYSLTAGDEFKVYSMRARSQPDREFRFAIPICYEDATPEICRGFVHGPDGRKRVDFLLNLSNDGWFGHDDELPQHMVASVFRAVEHRVGVARAVNTGISGFVDPKGQIHDCVTDGNRFFGPGIVGTRVSTIWTDTRHSLYTRWGDWIAHGCTVLSGLILLDASVIRALLSRRQRRTRNGSQST